MKIAEEEVIGLIVLACFYFISLPLTIYWLNKYKRIANFKTRGKRHQCITSRHFKTTWGYLICCICSSNIGHPLSIILYYLHSNIQQSTIVYSYLIADLSTFSVSFMCLIRAYMIMWDKKYNLARKQQFWTKKIVDNALEIVVGHNQIENDDENNNLSAFIRYRSTFGNVKYVSIFVLLILGPITISIIMLPFMIFPQKDIQYRWSSILRILCTIPIVMMIVFIYFKIPKYNESIGLKYEIRAIVQIFFSTFLLSNLLVSFVFFYITKIIEPRLLMLINGNIQIISAFLLFYASTEFMYTKLGQIIYDDSPTHSKKALIETPSKSGFLQRFRFKSNLDLVQNSSNTQRNNHHHNNNKNKNNNNNINNNKQQHIVQTPPQLPSPSFPALTHDISTLDPTVSAEKKLRKTITIYRRRKDGNLPFLTHNANINTNTTNTATNTHSKPTPMYKPDTFRSRGAITKSAGPLQDERSHGFIEDDILDETTAVSPQQMDDPVEYWQDDELHLPSIHHDKASSNPSRKVSETYTNTLKKHGAHSPQTESMMKILSSDKLTGRQRQNSTDRKFEIVEDDNSPIDEDDEIIEEDDDVDEEDDDDDAEVTGMVVLDEDDDNEIEIDKAGNSSFYSHDTGNQPTATSTMKPIELITPQTSTTAYDHSRDPSSTNKGIGNFNIDKLILPNAVTQSSNTVTFSHQQMRNKLSNHMNNSNGVNTPISMIGGAMTPIPMVDDHVSVTVEDHKAALKLANQTSKSGGNQNSGHQRRASLSVKGVKEVLNMTMARMIARTSFTHSKHTNDEDPEEMVAYKVTLEDPLYVVLADEDGLSHFADHLCSEFSIENLIFIIEALQYRKSIPPYLFDDVSPSISPPPNTNESDPNLTNSNNSPIAKGYKGGNDETVTATVTTATVTNTNEPYSKSEICELLMHIIHQNKKLPISKSLGEHQSFCRLLNDDKNNTNPMNRNHTNSPSQTIEKSHHDADFNQNDQNNDHHHYHTEHSGVIRRKQTKDKQRYNKCCKQCTAEKFKYIIEKYVKSTIINLPSALQLKLMYIWKELQKEPEHRFIDQKSKNKNPIQITPQKQDEIPSKKRLKLKKKRSNSMSNRGDIEYEPSKSKSKSHLIINKIMKRKKSNPLSITPKRASVLDEEELNKLEEQQQHKQSQLNTSNKTAIQKFLHKQQSIESIHAEMILHDKRESMKRQITESNTSSTGNTTINGSDDPQNMTPQIIPQRTKELVPSFSVSPREQIIMTNIDINSFSQHTPTTIIANTEHHDQISSNHQTQTSMHSESSQHDEHTSDENGKILSHITTTNTTPIDTKSSQIIESDKTTPTDNDESQEPPQPDSPPMRPTVIEETENNQKQTSIQLVCQNGVKSMSPTDSIQEMKGNESIHNTEDIDRRKEEEKEVKDMNERKEDEKFMEMKQENEVKVMNHDGFGRINFITVLDDAILEILGLIKGDPWRRFKRQKAFREWANDFKPS